jgi:RNA-binding protein
MSASRSKRSPKKRTVRAIPKPVPKPAAVPRPKRTKKRTTETRPRVEPPTEEQKAEARAARALSGKAVRHLRGLGHHLDPVVQIGKDGITEGLVAATREALLAHELVKVRVLAEAPIDRKVAGEMLADRAGAALAQTLGRTLLLYKRHPNKPTIVLPS